MSLVDLYSNEFKKRNEGHFAAIVRIALHDGKISSQERDFLDYLAVNLQISEAKYRDILANPEVYPINPPVAHKKRIERLYDLSRMVYLSKHMTPQVRRSILRKFIVALGFCSGDIEYLTDKVLELLSQNTDFKTFKNSIGTHGSDLGKAEES